MSNVGYLIIIIVILPGIFVAVDFLYFLLMGERQRKLKAITRVMECGSMAFALYFLWNDLKLENECCGDSAYFSPNHRLSVDVLIILCTISYFFTSYKRAVAPPIIEVITNCLLLTGVVLNVFIAVQIGDWWMWIPGNVPIIILFIFALVKNQELILDNMEDPGPEHSGRVTRCCRWLLRLRPVWKIPILLILCLPVLVLLIGALLLFGQKPDSLIRAFTDTYKYGFSKLDYQCAGVVCGGHFLCTIAAKGHSPVVKPVRLGIRGGQLIKCNRQLLISNAFEELLEQKFPRLHRPVRNLYNRIGARIHSHYDLLDNKWISDLIYVLMKPPEWCILLVLYCLDKEPENRIAQQYLSIPDRQSIRKFKAQ